jgi:hypothetical protein
MMDYLAQPRNEVFARPELATGAAKIKMRVSIHETGKYSDITQFHNRRRGCLNADGYDAAVSDGYSSTVNRRRINRENPAGSEREGLIG